MIVTAIAKKAMSVGYRRYGVPGAVALGVLTVAGYVLLRRLLDTTAQAEHTEQPIDVDTLWSAFDSGGVGALTNPDTLNEAIDIDAVATAIDDAFAQSSRSSAT
ncbi:hypothetical protein OB905_03805 [Halobacteria archaeon AArc-dxtr1]|nr:hypothetical protein [Halobacteria archaeon AArc-dxtr1]